MACRFDENPHGHETQSLPSGTKKLMEEQLGGDQHRQLFSEVLVAEDIDLGSRVHTLGFRCAPPQPHTRTRTTLQHTSLFLPGLLQRSAHFV